MSNICVEKRYPDEVVPCIVRSAKYIRQPVGHSRNWVTFRNDLDTIRLWERSGESVTVCTGRLESFSVVHFELRIEIALDATVSRLSDIRSEFESFA